MYAIIVEFEIVPEAFAAFLEKVRENARTSLRDEPACRRFDVLLDPERPQAVVLYEIYDDEAGFRHHLDTAHFRAFDGETAAMVAAKTVRPLWLASG